MARAMPIASDSPGSAATTLYLVDNAVVSMTFLDSFVAATLWASKVLSAPPPCPLSNPPKMDFMSFTGAVYLVRLVGLLALLFARASVRFLLPAFGKCGCLLSLYVVAWAWCDSKLRALMLPWLLDMRLVSHSVRKTRLGLTHSGACCVACSRAYRRVVRPFSCLMQTARWACVVTLLPASRAYLIHMWGPASQTVRTIMGHSLPACFGCTVLVPSTPFSMRVIPSFTTQASLAVALTTFVELRAATSKCKVWYRAGDALQLININSPRDHRHVVACLPLGLHFTGQPASRRVLWDHDALNRCVIYGERRHEFVSEVEFEMLLLASLLTRLLGCRNLQTHNVRCNVVRRLDETCERFGFSALLVLLSLGCLLWLRGWTVHPCNKWLVFVTLVWALLPNWPGCSLLVGWRTNQSSACVDVTAIVCEASVSMSCILRGRHVISQPVGSCPGFFRAGGLAQRNACFLRPPFVVAQMSGFRTCDALVLMVVAQLLPGTGKLGCNSIVIPCLAVCVHVTLPMLLLTCRPLVTFSGAANSAKLLLVGPFPQVFGACSSTLGVLPLSRKWALELRRPLWWLHPLVGAFFGSLCAFELVVAHPWFGMPPLRSPSASIMVNRVAPVSGCCMAWTPSASTFSCMSGDKLAFRSIGRMPMAMRKGAAENMPLCNNPCCVTAWIWQVAVVAQIFLTLLMLLLHLHMPRCCSLSRQRRLTSGPLRSSSSVLQMPPCSCSALMANWSLALGRAPSPVTPSLVSGFSVCTIKLLTGLPFCMSDLLSTFIALDSVALSLTVVQVSNTPSVLKRISLWMSLCLRT